MSPILTLVQPAARFYMQDILDLDLTLVKLKLHNQESGIRWKFKQCKSIEEEYKKFLALKRHYPDTLIVPGKMVDMFWHQHILDTEKYAKDCENIFGYFLHHKPYYGMHNEQERANFLEAQEETIELYKIHFGESPEECEVL